MQEGETGETQGGRAAGREALSLILPPDSPQVSQQQVAEGVDAHAERDKRCVHVLIQHIARATEGTRAREKRRQAGLKCDSTARSD